MMIAIKAMSKSGMTMMLIRRGNKIELSLENHYIDIKITNLPLLYVDIVIVIIIVLP